MPISITVDRVTSDAQGGRVEVIYSKYRRRLVIDVDGDEILRVDNIGECEITEMIDRVNAKNAAKPLTRRPGRPRGSKNK